MTEQLADINSPFNACMYREACRAEHAQRVTQQHHACDLAQEIEDLRFAAEAAGRRIAELEAERDELRSKLEDIEAQEPVAISKAGNLFWAGNPQDWRGVDCSLYTRPVPAVAVPTGERQAALLTDEQVAAVVARHWGRADIAPQSVREFARSIEAAAFAANGLEVRRG